MSILRLDKLECMARLVRIDTLNAVLEMTTRVQMAGGDPDELARDVKNALVSELDNAANDRIRMWQAH
jgi:hypothetical protein